MADAASAKPTVAAQELCSRCQKNPAEGIHPCPFAHDVLNDDEAKCDCCADCQHECAMDI